MARSKQTFAQLGPKAQMAVLYRMLLRIEKSLKKAAKR